MLTLKLIWDSGPYFDWLVIRQECLRHHPPRQHSWWMLTTPEREDALINVRTNQEYQDSLIWEVTAFWFFFKCQFRYVTFIRFWVLSYKIIFSSCAIMVFEKHHVKSVHEGQKFQCPHCEHKSTQKSNLQQHIKSIHEGKKFTCPHCGSTFTQKEHLQTT